MEKQSLRHDIDKMQNTVFAQRSRCIYSLNGLFCIVFVSIINTYIIPAVIHDMKTLRLKSPGYAAMAISLQKLLRKVIHLQKATTISALYLLTGSIPLETVHRKKARTPFVSMQEGVGRAADYQVSTCHEKHGLLMQSHPGKRAVVQVQLTKCLSAG